MKNKNIFIILFVMFFLLPVTVFAEEVCSYNISGWLIANKYTENTGNQQYSAEVVKLTIDNNKVSLSGLETNKNDYGLNWLGEDLLNWNKDKNGFSAVSGSCPNYVFIYVNGSGYDWYGSNTRDDYKKIDKNVYIFENSKLNKNIYMCEYPDFTLSVNNETKTLKASTKLEYVGEMHQESHKQYIFSEEFVTWYFETNTSNECLNVKMYVCEDMDRLTNVNPKFHVYTDEFLASKNESSMKYCNSITSTGSDENVKDPGCYTYGKKLDNLEGKYIEYNNEDCTGICKQQNKTAIRNEINDIKSFCNIVLSNLDVGNVCVDSCLTFKNSIVSFDNKYKFNSLSGSECGFSNKLINFVLNILKWVKYLVPALIIILSILDFIKAIGADKDEEMKKAQQKFIKRLVIAVLIFIVPFIIEFALDKMGFSYKDCGIF